MSTPITTPIGLSSDQLRSLASYLEDTGYLRLPILSQDDNGTVRFMLGGSEHRVNVHGTIFTSERSLALRSYRRHGAESNVIYSPEPRPRWIYDDVIADGENGAPMTNR